LIKSTAFLYVNVFKWFVHVGNDKNNICCDQNEYKMRLTSLWSHSTRCCRVGAEVQGAAQEWK